MAEFVTLLGFTGVDSAQALCAALRAVPGPVLIAVPGAELVALAQGSSAATVRRRQKGALAAMKDLSVIQRRLEAACAAGPFLPADPASACCKAADIGRLMANAASGIAPALRGPGAQWQWDIVLRWQPEPILAARRDEISAAVAAQGGGRQALAEAVQAALLREQADRMQALRVALATIAVAIQPGTLASATEARFTILLPRGQEGSIETTLQSLPEAVTAGAEADLRGPMPPVSFAAVRIDSAAAADVAAAWTALSLPDQVDGAGLRQYWRRAASRLHPDHGGQPAAPMVAAGSAFRLLRDLLPAQATQAPVSLHAVQRDAALRMHVRLTGLDLAA